MKPVSHAASAAALLVIAIAPAAFGQKTNLSYVGPGGCAASDCHGSTAPAPEKSSRILTTEYALWAIHDKHTDAGKVLSSARATRIAEILGLSNASTAKRCTACHVAGSPATPQAVSDGVACEACHGPAEKWLGTHVQSNSHATSLQNGMIDLRDPLTRAKTCMECHVGTAEKLVDHQLIAAGHPDLPFELDTFSQAQPSHARPQAPSEGNSLPRVRLWAVGQSTHLSLGMKELARRAETSWPDYATLECSQCHHLLRADSWRIQRGYQGRPPGSLQVNPAATEVVRVLAAHAAPGQHAALDASLDKLASVVALHPGDGAAIAQAAREVERQADLLTVKMRQMDFTKQSASQLIRAINADIVRIANQGVYAAEQATMSLDSLAAAITANDPKVQGEMRELYSYLEHPSAYTSRDFASLFHKVSRRFE